MRERFDVIVIGGGQAGLAMGYQLARRGIDLLILDAAERTGDAWRERWDSLTLFTPARYSALPGLVFPADPQHMPRKDEVADYLESYAEAFSLPIARGERVVRLEQISEWRGFRVITETRSYEAEQVVIATGPFQKPIIPHFAHALPNSVVQMHSSSYRNPGQLPPGDVVVIGGGNSGAQIASELAQSQRTWLSIGEQLPVVRERIFGRSLFWWLERTGALSVSVNSRIGRKMSMRDVVIGKSPAQLAREEGVRLVGRTVGVEGSLLSTQDGALIDAAAIIWATGFRQDFSWIHAPVFDDQGRALQTRGVTPVRGLYFLGLPWMHTRGSALVGWVGRDAEYLAERIAY